MTHPANDSRHAELRSWMDKFLAGDLEISTWAHHHPKEFMALRDELRQIEAPERERLQKEREARFLGTIA